MYKEQIEKFISSLDKTKNTCESYRRDLNQMDDYLRANENSTALDYANYIKEEKKASTVARVYSSMNSFFKYMMQTGQLSTNPIDGIIAPRVEKNPRRVLNEKEKEEMRNMPKGYGNKAVRDRAMIAVMFDTGYKVSKLIDLKMKDVEGLSLSLQSRVVLDDYIYGTRNLMLNGNECDNLFTNCDGKPMTRQGFWKILKTYTKNGEF